MPVQSVSWVIEHLLNAKHCPGYRDMSHQGAVTCPRDGIHRVHCRADSICSEGTRRDITEGRAFGLSRTGSYGHEEKRTGAPQVQDRACGEAWGQKSAKRWGPNMLAQGTELRSVRGKSQ